MEKIVDMFQKKKRRESNLWPDKRKTLAQQIICQRIAEGESLRAICCDEGRPKELPCFSTAWRWMREDDGFAELYNQARTFQADHMADEIVAIADSVTDCTDSATVQAARLRVDARKWVASKLRPQRWGDRQQIEMSGKLDLTNQSTEELKAELAALRSRTGV